MTTGTANHPSAAARAYSFGARHAAGLWLGLGLGPMVTLAVSLLGAVLLVTAGASVAVGIAVILIAAAIALPRVGRRPLLSWLAIAVTHVTARAAGVTGWVDRQALDAPAPAGGRMRLPREYGRLQLRSCPDGDVGVVIDAATRTATVVFRVGGIDRFPLLDALDQDELIDGWGQALAILVDTDRDLVRLQMLDRVTAPDADLADGGNVREVTARRSVSRETLLVAGWRLPRDAAAARVTAERCRAMATALLTARLLIRPLSTTETASALARTLNPTAGGASVAPLSRRVRWDEVATGDTLHRSYLISGWPATPVPAGWLIPLLLCTPAGAARSLAVHLQPLAPADAARIARAERARAQLDRADRARLGLTPTAAVDRAEASSISLDDELAAGYRTHRLSGVLTVSAPTRASLDAAASEVVQSAAAARLELTVLHGQHHLGLAATAPLCRIVQRGTR